MSMFFWISSTMPFFDLGRRLGVAEELLRGDADHPLGAHHADLAGRPARR